MLFSLTSKRLRPHWVAIVIIVVAQVIGTLAALYLPSLNADIIDHGVAKGDVHYIWTTGALMLGVTLAQAVASALATYFAALVAMALGAQLRREVFTKVQRFSGSDIRDFGPPTLITRATNDVTQVQNVVFFTFIIMIMAPIMGVGGVVMALRQDVQLSWLLVAIVPFMAVVIGLLMRRLVPLFRLQQKRLDRINNDMREQLTGVRVIRAFAREDEMAARFEHSNRALQRVALSIGRVFAVMFPMLQLIFSASTVAVVWFGAWRIDSGSMQVGALFAFLTYLAQILMSVMMAAMIFTMVPRAQVCADRISEVLDRVPSVVDAAPAERQNLPEGPLSFVFDAVTLQFPGASSAVLRDLNFTIEPGSTWGVIGATGSGKSTLTRLLTRQLDPSEGAVRASGIDLRRVALEELRQRIAVVPQQVYLFGGTIASTVSGLDEEQIDEAVRDRVRQALDAAQATEFVGQLPEGLAAPVEAGGANFSGGQRQRLSIARALYRQADLLILDDAAAALDYLTESKLRAALQNLPGQPSVVIVAQRVSSLRHADQILVLDDGHVVGRGTHEELLENCPTYQEIVSSQLSAEEIAAGA